MASLRDDRWLVPAADTVTVVSQVLSAFIDGCDTSVLAEPATVTVRTTSSNPTCAFYNETTLEWSTDGVTTQSTTIEDGETVVVCLTTHFTNFAAIVVRRQCKSKPDLVFRMRLALRLTRPR